MSGIQKARGSQNGQNRNTCFSYLRLHNKPPKTQGLKTASYWLMFLHLSRALQDGFVSVLWLGPLSWEFGWSLNVHDGQGASMGLCAQHWTCWKAKAEVTGGPGGQSCHVVLVTGWPGLRGGK